MPESLNTVTEMKTTSDKLINRLDQAEERICTGGYLNSNPLTAGNKQDNLWDENLMKSGKFYTTFSFWLVLTLLN